MVWTDGRTLALAQRCKPGGPPDLVRRIGEQRQSAYRPEKAGNVTGLSTVADRAAQGGYKGAVSPGDSGAILIRFDHENTGAEHYTLRDLVRLPLRLAGCRRAAQLDQIRSIRVTRGTLFQVDMPVAPSPNPEHWRQSPPSLRKWAFLI